MSFIGHKNSEIKPREIGDLADYVGADASATNQCTSYI